ncbi:MAG: GNAT family N-acetyltransferase [Ktedonobacterales bacterium]
MAETSQMHDDTYTRKLGDGLVLRWSMPQDVERVASLYAHVFRSSPDAPLNWHIPYWTRDMFSGRHPHIGPRDFAVVENTTTGMIVASTCLLRYTFEFEGIPVHFGRPEVVATQPEHRKRGLIRAIFELIHAKSEARGDLVQGITGIPHYYRQFGYEYAIALGTSFTVYFPAIPTVKKDVTEPFTLRRATVDDIPLLRHLEEREQMGAAITTPLSVDYHRWAMEGMCAEALERWNPYLIVDAGGRSVGYLRLRPGRWGSSVDVDGLMVEAGVPLVAVVPSVLRGVRALAETTVPMRPETPPAAAVRFQLQSGGHALHNGLGDLAAVGVTHPYSAYPDLWYIRVPDLPRFVKHVAPALERRLAATAQAGYTGELALDFYRSGLRLLFEGGKLAAVEDWQRPLWGEGKAGFPPLVFLQLLFSYRSLHELRSLYPDVWAEGEAAPVLDALFPKRHSSLIPLD